MALQENINVVARVRPFSDWIQKNRQSCLIIDTENSIITVKTTVKDSRFDLNSVFDENATQEMIYNHVSPSVTGFLEGINGTIFAYGQTGSGKTYTMLGPEVDESADEVNRGVIPRAVENIFESLNAELEQKPETFKFSMKCSMVELYNEKIYDLLQDNDDTTIKIQTSLEQIVVVGAAEFEVTTAEECMHHLWRGWNQRKVAETKMNRESSRSHAIFMLTLVTEHFEGTVINRRSSRLNLVDLAGSERQGQTNNAGIHLKEAGSINKSLSILARIIRSLSAKNHKFISYRDSLLTLLLRDSLGGNARTTVVVNIHPNCAFVGDTISTLNFAVNVKKVKNTAQVNEAISSDDVKSWSAEITRLRKENGEIKVEKLSLEEKNEKLLSENQELQDTNKSLRSQLDSYLNRSARRPGFAAMLERESEDIVPGKLNFEDENDSSNTSTLSNAQRKQRRQTQFLPRSVQPPSYADLQKRLAETEKALEEEEKSRSESELEVNKLFQIVAERDARIRQLDASENEKTRKILEHERKITLLEERIADQKEQIVRFEEGQKECADSICVLQEEKELLEAQITEMEIERDQKLEAMKVELKEIKLKMHEMEKQRDDTIQKLAEAEKALEKEESVSSECELKVNTLKEIVGEKDDCLREKTEKVYECEEKIAVLEKRVADQAKQVIALEKFQEKDAERILILQEDKQSQLAQMKNGYGIKIKELVGSLDEAYNKCEWMKTEILELEKQRNDAMQKLAENNGHLNHAQKIHYVENMKKEMISLRNEVTFLKSIIKSKGIQIPDGQKENKAPGSNFRFSR